MLQGGWFRHWHRHQLLDPCDSTEPDYYRRSLFGLIGVYNVLPDYVVATTKIKDIQKELQAVLVYVAATGYEQWRGLYSKKGPLHFSIRPRVQRRDVYNVHVNFRGDGVGGGKSQFV